MISFKFYERKEFSMGSVIFSLMDDPDFFVLILEVINFAKTDLFKIGSREKCLLICFRLHCQSDQQRHFTLVSISL
jgi:hypothetical protein